MADEMDILREIEATWGVALPTRFRELFSALEWNAVRLRDGSVFRFNLPMLTPKQILDAHRLRVDWELPSYLVPIAGDFHELIGLDYSNGDPRVVAATDDRTFTELFTDFNVFLEGRILIDDHVGDADGIVDAWLDF